MIDKKILLAALFVGSLYGSSDIYLEQHKDAGAARSIAERLGSDERIAQAFLDYFNSQEGKSSADEARVHLRDWMSKHGALMAQDFKQIVNRLAVEDAERLLSLVKDAKEPILSFFVTILASGISQEERVVMQNNCGKSLALLLLKYGSLGQALVAKSEQAVTPGAVKFGEDIADVLRTMLETGAVILQDRISEQQVQS